MVTLFFPNITKDALPKNSIEPSMKYCSFLGFQTTDSTHMQLDKLPILFEHFSLTLHLDC
jgi:hypothetical protein